MPSTLHSRTLLGLPKGLCSWSFYIQDPDHNPVAELNVSFGKCVIQWQGADYVLKRGKGLFKAPWHLFGPQEELLATSMRPFSLIRTRFEIEMGPKKYVLERIGAGFELREDDRILATFKRAHGFTNRRIFTLEPETPLLLFLFCFGLILYKEMNDSDSGN